MIWKFFALLVAINANALAQPRPCVRFWEGQKNGVTTAAGHHQFIAQTLAPATVAQGGGGSLTSYVVYLPPAGALPAEAFGNQLSFSEAAIPIYRDQLAYDTTRATHPEYGPLHFADNGFDSNQSYSAVPKRFTNGDIVELATSSNKVAYDLSVAEMTVDGAEPTVDWQQGKVLVLLVLRRKGVSEAVYLRSVANHFEEFAERIEGCNAHFVRVGADHLLHMLHCKQAVDTPALQAWFADLVASRDDKFMLHDAVEAKRLAPFAQGWTAAFTFGSAINVQFPK